MAILSLHSLVTMMCAFDSTFPCAYFRHTCSMVTLQAELMPRNKRKKKTVMEIVYEAAQI